MRTHARLLVVRSNLSTSIPNRRILPCCLAQLSKLQDQVRERLHVIFTVGESVALLDMLASFATYAQASGAPYARPLMGDGCGLTLKACRHPILEASGDVCVVANSVNIQHATNFQESAAAIQTKSDSSTHDHPRGSATLTRNNLRKTCRPLDATSRACPCSSSCFSSCCVRAAPAPQLITGPNMSGKSTYLRQTALTVLLAHIGCHVPAEVATVPLLHRVLTRIGMSDSLETNSSTFTCEMRETSYILKSLGRPCLVIVDELGRGTSNREGVSIAWAVAEALLLQPNTFTLFATHYLQLSNLRNLYPEHVRNLVLQVEHDEKRLKFTHTCARVKSSLVSSPPPRSCAYPAHSLSCIKSRHRHRLPPG